MTPVPPPELRERVGTIEGTKDEFELEGRMCHESIMASLPAGFSFDDKRVLDFGCGAGRTLRQFLDVADRNEIWGCDVHEPSIAWLREHLCPPLHAFVNDLEPPLLLDDSSFDLVYGLSVFTHLADDWSAWLVELHRLLRAGGIAVITFLNEPMWNDLAGKPFFQDELKRAWDEDATGMLVTNYGLPQDDIGPVVYHSEWWLREHWGRAFDILRLRRWGFAQEPGLRAGHGWVTMRKRDVAVDRAALEVPGPSGARELRAVQTNLAYVHREMAAWRRLASAAGGAYEAAQARADELAARLAQVDVPTPVPPPPPRRWRRARARG